MTAKRVVAVLDRPAPQSLGMLGLVVAQEDGTLITEGVQGSQAGTLSAVDLNDLVDGGHAISVDDLTLHMGPDPFAALWLGAEFVTRAGKAGVHVPPLPQQTSRQVSTGTFWVAPARHVWRILDSWTVQAFRKVVATQDGELARLMSWVLPDRPETRAARWLTASSNHARSRDIDWWVRVDRESGRPEITPQALTAELESLITHTESEPLQPVIGFSALAKGGDKEIADFVARTKEVPRLSFGAWLREKALKEGGETDRRGLQHLGQQMIKQMGELAFFFTMLDDVHLELSQSLLIEGIRHIKILDSVRSLVGPDRFFLAFVDRPEDRRLELLRHEGLSNSELEEVLSDATEQEIPRVRKFANIELDASLDVEVEGNRLLRALSA